MAKNIIKEITIFLLLTLAIILVLGVLLYEYVPMNKIIPEKVLYTTPEQAKAELKEDVSENNEELYIDYHIDSTQLNNYKKIQEYIPGKKNPFESLEKNSNITEDGTDSTTQNSTNKNENGISSGTNSVKDENSGYLPDKGTK